MSAPRKFDREFRERAVRLYRERLQQHDESKAGARRQVGVLLDVNPATLRNWVEDAERADGVRALARPGWPSRRRCGRCGVRTPSCAARTRSSRPRECVFRSGGARPVVVATQVVVACIDTFRGRFGVEPILAVLTEHGVTIAPSTYDAHRACPVSPAALEEAYVANALVTLHQPNWGVYGVRELWHAARRAGLDVGRDQTAR